MSNSDSPSKNQVEDISTSKKANKHGKAFEFDSSFKGPIHKRSCTDVICLAIFIIFNFVGLIIALYAYSKSNPFLLINPTNSHGQLCGYGELESKPYLHYFDLIECAKSVQTVALTGCPTTQVCVAACPNVTWNWLTLEAHEQMYGIDINLRRSQLLCGNKVDFSNESSPWLSLPIKDLITEEFCAPYLVPSLPIFQRCIPSFIVKAVAQITSHSGVLVNRQGENITEESLAQSRSSLRPLFEVQSYLQGFLADLAASWRQIVILTLIALFVSFLWIITLRIVVAPVVWFTIVVFILLWFAITTLAFWRYNQLANIVDIPDAIDVIVAQVVKNDTANSSVIPNETPTLWCWIGFISLAIFLILLLALCFLGSRIRLAIKLFEEASTALGHMPSVLLWPTFPFVCQMAIMGIAIGTAICLATVGRPEFAHDSNPGLINLPLDLSSCDYSKIVKEAVKSNVSAREMVAKYVSDNATEAIEAAKVTNASLGEMCRFVKFKASDYMAYFQVFNAFMFFWGYHFLACFGIAVLAGSFASYYWAFQKPKDIPAIPLFSSFWRTIRYHLGSIAFGSLIIAIITMVRIILDYIMYKLKGQRNMAAAFVLKCVNWCLACLERAVKYMARKAYIMMAIHGKNFCISALDAFQLLMRNVLRAVILTGISKLIIFMSKLVVTGGIVALAYFYFHGELVEAIPSLKPTWPQLNYFYVPIIVSGLAAFAVSSICFNVYEVGVETMFMCFLEDCERNDGSQEMPYFMSKRLAAILR